MQDLNHVSGVSGLGWLSELPAAELDRLRSSSAEQLYEAGELIFAPAEKPHSVYMLLRGSVRIYRLSDAGQEATLGYVAPGEVFGEMAAFMDVARESFAEASVPSRVWRVRREPFRQLVSQRPELAVEITKQAGRRLQRIEARVEDLAFRTARARLARVLLELAQDFGEEASAGIVIELPLTQLELASLIGATRQTVNLHMREFERYGLSLRSHRRIVLLDRARLAAMVDEPA
jgi:CRP-like cAMP-binding protein